MKILFVCTGNTCRSPMAAALASYILGPAVKALSAGLYAQGGSSASPQAIAILRRRGLDLSAHQAQGLTGSLILEANRIVTMTAGHKQTIVKLYPESSAKLYTWGEWLADEEAQTLRPGESQGLSQGDLTGRVPSKDPTGQPLEISDPWGGPLSLYEQCATTMEEILTRIRRARVPKDGG